MCSLYIGFLIECKDLKCDQTEELFSYHPQSVSILLSCGYHFPSAHIFSCCPDNFEVTASPSSVSLTGSLWQTVHHSVVCKPELNLKKTTVYKRASTFCARRGAACSPHVKVCKQHFSLINESLFMFFDATIYFTSSRNSRRTSLLIPWNRCLWCPKSDKAN